MDVYKMQLVKVGPSLRERIGSNLRKRVGHFLAGRHHKATVARLRHFREELEAGLQPEPWTTLETSAVTLLADVCDALLLSPDEKAEVLGPQGEATHNIILDGLIALQADPLNERQAQAIARLQEQGRITNRDYQELCPDVSSETLRLDLDDLVARGLLQRHGDCKDTYYVAAV